MLDAQDRTFDKELSQNEGAAELLLLDGATQHAVDTRGKIGKADKGQRFLHTHSNVKRFEAHASKYARLG